MSTILKTAIFAVAIAMLSATAIFAQTSDSDNVGQGPWALAKVTAFLPNGVPNGTSGVLKANWTLEDGSTFQSDSQTFNVNGQPSENKEFVCPSSYIPVKIHIYGQIGSKITGWHVSVTETITSNPMYIYIQSYEWQRYDKDEPDQPGGTTTD